MSSCARVGSCSALLLSGALLLAVWLAKRGAPVYGAPGEEIIRPCFDETCAHWLDTSGKRIEAHSASVVQHPSGDRWYWYGESKKTSDLGDHGVNCYSAASLAGPWQFEGEVLHQSQISVAGQPGPFVVERPRVLYNAKTGLFVMWFHLDIGGYKLRQTGVATSANASGPFQFVHSMQPDGVPSLDMSLWRDWDETAYLVRSCDNRYVGVSKLSPDYLTTTGMLSTAPLSEGMAMFRHPNGTLYMISSHLTGWDPNPLILFRSDGPSLEQPDWVNLGNPTNDPHSFNTQPTAVVPFTTATGETYFIYMADNWIHAGYQGLVDAAYVWLPLRFDSGGQAVLSRLLTWDLQHPELAATTVDDSAAVDDASNASSDIFSDLAVERAADVDSMPLWT
mmetsp:Transcript_20824/g.37959  ORF Transcript_20824/g.37959 Transcript_20824/m.37959 type:complete len:393 (-) Transcript_20824:20-1198(-)